MHVKRIYARAWRKWKRKREARAVRVPGTATGRPRLSHAVILAHPSPKFANGFWTDLFGKEIADTRCQIVIILRESSEIRFFLFNACCVRIRFYFPCARFAFYLCYKLFVMPRYYANIGMRNSLCNNVIIRVITCIYVRISMIQVSLWLLLRYDIAMKIIKLSRYERKNTYDYFVQPY